MTDFSIVIPAYNEEAFLPRTLAAVHAATAGVIPAVEIIVVDNNSDDRTAEIATSLGAYVVREPINQIARARNTGARAAAGRFLVFLDADTILPVQLFAAVQANLASGRIAGGGATVAADRPVHSVGTKILAGWNLFSRIFRLAAGSFIYCSRKGFEAVGGFDERVYASEEIWFSIGLRRWARRCGKEFVVIDRFPVVTSIRKLDWFSPGRLLLSTLVIVLFPFALFSRRLCHIWYDRSGHPPSNPVGR